MANPQIYKLTLKAAEVLNNGCGGTLLEIIEYIQENYCLKLNDKDLNCAVRAALKKGIRKRDLRQDYHTKRYHINTDHESQEESSDECSETSEELSTSSSESCCHEADPKVYKLSLKAAHVLNEGKGGTLLEIVCYIRENNCIDMNLKDLKCAVRAALKRGICKCVLRQDYYTKKYYISTEINTEELFGSDDSEDSESSDDSCCHEADPKIYKLSLEAAQNLNDGEGGTILEIINYIRLNSRIRMSDEELNSAVRDALKKGICKQLLRQNYYTKRYYINCGDCCPKHKCPREECPNVYITCRYHKQDCPNLM